MKPNAQQFFDIWQDAVVCVGQCYEDPSRADFYHRVFGVGVEARHGLALTSWALSYLAQLNADTARRGTV